MMRKRGVIESLSMLVLLGVVVVTMLVAFVLLPQYYNAYNSVALISSYSQSLQGIRTSATLTRVPMFSSYVLSVIIYNYGDSQVSVKYAIDCHGYGEYYTGMYDAIIQPYSIYSQTYSVDKQVLDSVVCYLVVEEQGLTAYRVMETG
jgi:preprotein translocase subunit SecG